MNEKRINLLALARNSKGKIFSVKFIKKNGQARAMTCRMGVTKYLRNGFKTNHNPNHLVVFDMEKEAYRTVNFETVIQLKINDQTYKGD